MPRKPSLTAAIDAFIDQKAEKDSIWREEQLEAIEELYDQDSFELIEKINKRIRKRMNETNN